MALFIYSSFILNLFGPLENLPLTQINLESFLFLFTVKKIEKILLVFYLHNHAIYTKFCHVKLYLGHPGIDVVAFRVVDYHTGLRVLFVVCNIIIHEHHDVLVF